MDSAGTVVCRRETAGVARFPAFACAESGGCARRTLGVVVAVSTSRRSPRGYRGGRNCAVGKVTRSSLGAHPTGFCGQFDAKSQAPFRVKRMFGGVFSFEAMRGRLRGFHLSLMCDHRDWRNCSAKSPS